MNMRESPYTLFITAVPPEDVVGGGGTATRSMLEILRSAPINARVRVEATRRETHRIPRRVQQAMAMLRSVGSRLSSKSLFDLPVGSVKRLRHLLASSRFDLVVINGGQLFFLAEYLAPGTPTLGIAHNVESMLYEEQIASLPWPSLMRAVLARDLRKLENSERHGLRRVGKILCLSCDDALALAKIEPGISTLSQPTTFSYRPQRREPGGQIVRPLRLGFLAKYSWWPNSEAVRWFVDHVLSELEGGLVEVHLYGPGAERFGGKHPAITAHGYVSELSAVWQQSDIFICPMRSGSGINVKFIEAIYNGIPVLATSLASRGIPEICDKAVVLRDDANEWAAFLASEAAVALAESCPSDRTRSLFTEKGAAARLHAFLNTAVDESAQG